MRTNKLLSDIKDYVESFFRVNHKPCLLYHNLDHTLQVVQHTEEIAGHYLLDSDSFFSVMAAAWFHDTAGEPEGHEERSVQIMKEFLATKGIEEKIITEISSCIMGTKMPAVATTLVEQIICDADTTTWERKIFCILTNWCGGKWNLDLRGPLHNKVQRSLLFLERHQFFTSYCRQLLSAGKERNISTLKSSL
jgi:HD superfamily phosphodiesterase